MSIRDYLVAIRRGWWMIVAGMVLGAAAAVGVVAGTSPAYAGTVTFFVNTSASHGVSPLQGDQYAQQRVATYARLVSSDRLAELVKADTGSPRSVRAIAESITGKSPLNTVLLTATVTAPSRPEAHKLTTSVSTQFVTMIRTIDPTVTLEVTSGPAVQPGPISPRPKLDLALGIAAGVLLGACGAIARRALDTTVRTAADLETATSVDTIGVIARDRRFRRTPLLTGPAARSARAEQFRVLRTNLAGRRTLDAAGVLAVTSADYREGKTSTAANLAITLANGGRHVLLVDADLRRPLLATYWHLRGPTGLADALAGEADADACLCDSPVQRLTLLPAGTRPTDPAELVGSPAMAGLVAHLRRQFDVIIIDTPPVLAVTDAVVTARQADGALLVARWGKTPLARVAQAADALDAGGARLLGCVLTMAVRSPAVGYAHPTAPAGNPMRPAASAVDRVPRRDRPLIRVAGDRGDEAAR